MKLEMISIHQEISEKTREIIISNHGITYKITSDFHGICITNDDITGGIVIYTCDNKNKIIIK